MKKGDVVDNYFKQQEKEHKLLELYRQWVSLEYSPVDREKLMVKIQKIEEEMK